MWPMVYLTGGGWEYISYIKGPVLDNSSNIQVNYHRLSEESLEENEVSVTN